MRQLRVADRRAQVGEQAKVLAQPEDCLLGPQRALERVVLPVADRAEQHRVGRLRQLQCRVGQRMAMGLVRRAADRRRLELESQVERAEHLERFGNDLGADAVAGQDRDLHGSALSQCTRRCSQVLNTTYAATPT